jgi:hypothetical protein
LVAVVKRFGAGIPGLPYLSAPKSGNVLYLDWERDEEVHRQRITAIKQGIGITEGGEIYYIRCDRPISAMIDYLCKKVADLDVELVIVDSQMAATASIGTGKNDAEVSSEYHNCLRRFNCTTLTIDHTTKAGMSDDSPNRGTTMPFGSVVKYNRATSAYSIETTQDTESDVLSLKLKHEKFNLGRKQADRGIEIEFENDDQDQLIGLHFRSFDLADHETFRKRIPGWQIIASILRTGSKDCTTIAAEAKELDSETKLDTKRVYDLMKQKPKVFVQEEQSRKWRLVNG